MADDKKFYITTPIYYVNGVPHVGSATTTLLCDALARYHRLRGEPTFFLTGTDEHAQKVADAAAKAGQSPQEFVDDVSGRYREAWAFLNISEDDFIRTSEPRHKEVVQEVFRRLRARGDIYAGKYEGWYSVSDETFFRDSEVKDGVATETGAKVERVTEDNYYFRLSSYGDQLLAHIEAHPDFLQPETRRNEVLAFLKSGLRDIAVSRPNTGWGIEVPEDPSQIIYVWFDACINYLSATGWPNDPNWDTLWPADVHLVGKEIYTRFHATLWPTMLLGLDLPLPRHVLGHGWWLIGGEKGAKSKGNIPTPQEAVGQLVTLSGASEQVAVDALRYYLIRDISFTSDVEFSFENLITRYNSELANNLGNLLNRALSVLHKFAAGLIPTRSLDISAVAALALETKTIVEDALRLDRPNGANPGAALEVISRFVAANNKAIYDAAPWNLLKDETTRQNGADALYDALEACRFASVLLAPFIPHTAALIRAQLGLGDAPLGQWDTELRWGNLPTGTQTQEAQPIFPRIEKRVMTPENTQAIPTPPEIQAALPVTNTITIEDFAKVQLKVAEIKTAERIEGATKLLRLIVDIGGGEERQILAGIAENHAPEDLLGKKIVVVANLQPRKMRGLESQGMLLAATDADGRAILLHPEDPSIAPGAQVR